MCVQLLALFHDSTVTFPSIPGGDSASTYLSSLLSGGPLPTVDHPSKAQSIFQHSLDFHNFSALLNSCSLHDQARIPHHSCASAWLRAIPSESLGLTLSGQELVVALQYWLGIPLFPASARCFCGTVIDGFGC